MAIKGIKYVFDIKGNLVDSIDWFISNATTTIMTNEGNYEKFQGIKLKVTWKHEIHNLYYEILWNSWKIRKSLKIGEIY